MAKIHHLLVGDIHDLGTTLRALGGELHQDDLGEGRRGVWVWVTGVKVSDAGRAEMEAVRKSLRLS